MEDLARLSGSRTAARVLRRAEEGDASALLALVRAMAADGASLGAPGAGVAGERWAADWIRGYGAAGRILLVAVVDGRPAGFATASAGPPPALSHVVQLGLFVEAACRRLGIGSALLDAVIRWAGLCPGVDKLQLAVLASHPAAIALYRRHGFRQEGRLRGQIQGPDGERTDQLLMARGVPRGRATACPEGAGLSPANR